VVFDPEEGYRVTRFGKKGGKVKRKKKGLVQQGEGKAEMEGRDMNGEYGGKKQKKQRLHGLLLEEKKKRGKEKNEKAGESGDIRNRIAPPEGMSGITGRGKKRASQATGGQGRPEMGRKRGRKKG